jgi:hypothetical protein
MIVVAAVIIFFPAAHARAADEAASSQEKEFIAVLQSDAAAADKAIACKRLAISGSAAAVPDLAKLLPDPQLSSWARIALEAMLPPWKRWLPGSPMKTPRSPPQPLSRSATLAMRPPPST